LLLLPFFEQAFIDQPVVAARILTVMIALALMTAILLPIMQWLKLTRWQPFSFAVLAVRIDARADWIAISKLHCSSPFNPPPMMRQRVFSSSLCQL
jgi:hypothetical protein